MQFRSLDPLVSKEEEKDEENREKSALLQETKHKTVAHQYM